MNRPESRDSHAPYLFAGSLVLGILFTADARAQSSDKGGSPPQLGGAAAAKGDRPGAKAAAGAAQGQAKPRNGPSEDYQESIRRTVDRRRQRRARRAQGASDSRPPGAIVPWPMPPALIIRQTSQTHDEIQSFLGLLRK